MTQLVLRVFFVCCFSLKSSCCLKTGGIKVKQENKTVGFLGKDIFFAFDAKDTIEWLGAYRVATSSRGALRSLTILLAPLEGKVNEPKSYAVIGHQRELSLASTGVIARSVPPM